MTHRSSSPITDTSLDSLLDSIAHVFNEVRKLQIANNYLLDTIDRFKQGLFTPDELQNLCHNLSVQDKCAFAKGCEEYQKSLFGVGSIEEERLACAAICKKHWYHGGTALDAHNDIIGRGTNHET